MIDLKKIKQDILTLVNAQLSRNYPPDPNNGIPCKALEFSFLPFQTKISDLILYVKEPPSSPVNVSVYSELEEYYTSETTLVPNANTFSLNINCPSSIPITVKITSGEEWEASKSSKVINVYDSCIADNEPLNYMVAFSITPLKNIMFPVYPYSMLEKDYMPLITTDVTSRVVRQRYIDINRLEENIKVSFVVISSSHFELDSLISALEDILCRNRINIPNIFVMTPENLSNISIVGNDLLSRQVTYRAVLFAKNRF
jgi:hypothetical protein